MAIRLVIADDHELYRSGLILMLGKYEDVQVVGEASNGKELIWVVEKEAPDIVLTDINMPVMDGIEATKLLKERFINVQAIALSIFDEDKIIIDMLEAGASGYLMKNSEASEVIAAIKSVYKRLPYYCRQTKAKLAQMVANRWFNPQIKKANTEFSEKELEIIRLICTDISNEEIARKLYLSKRTIEGYKVKIMEKMKAKSNVGIVIYAIRHGIYSVR